MRIYLCLIVLLLPSGISCLDATLQERAFGYDVADAVVRRITRAGIFPSDQSFLRRVGFVETQFGEDDGTYRPNYFGGIWQVDEPFFNQTKGLTDPPNIYQLIQAHFNITWEDVTWRDLLKPMYSGLAARLYIQSLVNSENPLNGTVALQAIYWAQHYRGNGSVELFQQRVKALESDVVCQGEMDICIVLDASGSIGQPNFAKAVGFVADLVATLSNETTKVSYLYFGDVAHKRFDFNHILTSAQMDANIRSTRYPQPDQWTNTPAGLNMAVSFFAQQNNPRPGIPHIVTTFTDGNHSPQFTGAFPGALNAVRNANLTSFSIGIGSGIDTEELLRIALDDPTRVFEVDDYDALVEFFYQMNQAACEVPQEPDVGQNQTGTLAPKEKRYFKYDLAEEGMTFFINNDKVNGYYSYTEETPNSAVHDGAIKSAGFIPKRDNDTTGVFIAIQTNSETPVTYTITTDIGNKVPPKEDNNSAGNLMPSVAVLLCTLFYSVY